MVGQVLRYPLELAQRQPTLVLTFIIAMAGLQAGIVVVFASHGHDMIAGIKGVTNAAIIAYVSFASAVYAGVGGMFCADVLVDLGERDAAHEPTFADALRTIAVQALVCLPALPMFALAVFSEATDSSAAALLLLMSIVPTTFVGLRLSFALPRTLITRRVAVYSTWSETENQALRLFGFWILIAVAAIPAEIIKAPIWLFRIETPPLETLAAALNPRSLTTILLNSLSAGVTATYYYAASMRLFQLVRDRKSGLNIEPAA